MSQTKDDIPVGSTAWVDINTAADIPVGDYMRISLKSVNGCRLYEGDTAPALDYTGGEVLTDRRYPSNRATIKIGSLKIWALSTQEDRSVDLSVQGE